MLRRLPRRIDRIGGALEDGRLTVSVRILADPSDRRYLTGLVHRVLLAFLAAAAGIMAVLMIGIHGGPALSKTVSLYSFFGYCLLVIAAILAVRVLVQVFRPDPSDPTNRRAAPRNRSPTEALSTVSAVMPASAGAAVTVRVRDGLWRGGYWSAGPAAAWAMRLATASGCDT